MSTVRLGLRENLGQFSLLVVVNAFVGAMVGMERSILPAIAEPFYLGVVFVALGLLLSALVVRETKHHVAAESKLHGDLLPEGMPTQREVFWRTTLFDKNLSSVSQAGLVNNLNDGMAWGIFPLLFSAARMDLRQIGLLAAIYPATWGIAQLFTGAWSDRVGRKWLVTVCGKGGGRSERAAEQLRASGFSSARSLCGGTQAWMQMAAQGE